MRTIVLVEADHNLLNNKLLGKRAMAYSEQHNALAPEQYGSRKKLSASQASVNNRLMHDLMRQTRQGGIICSNDAKSCYDCIVHSVLSLSLQRLGVPQPPIQSMLTTIQKMRHQIRTAYGTSSSSYSSQPGLPPLQGVIQGHGTAPTGWSITSTPLINAVRNAGFGFKHTSAISHHPLTVACTAFVDDTDLWLSASPSTTTPSTTLRRAQEMLDLWNGVLHSTGGALVASKSHWHWIDFQWDGSSWQYATPDANASLTIYNYDTQQREPLQLLSSSQGRRTLGVYLRPDGREDATIEALLQKSISWASNLRSRPLPASLAWLALKTTLLKTLEYPLAATTLTATDCQRILWPALRTALPMCHIQRRFPRNILHSPPTAMGLGIPSLYLSQLQQHITTIIKHGHEESITGQLLRASMETLRLELGTDHFPLDLPWNLWGFLATPTWITSTWQSLFSFNLSITDTTTSPSPLRHDDRPIMEYLLPRVQDHHTLRILNHCRLYLRLFWLSELHTTSGTHLIPSLLRGSPSKTSVPLHHWPRQGPPSRPMWTLWQKTLVRHLCTHTHATSYPSAIAFGPYLHHWADPRQTSTQWCSLWDPIDDRVFVSPSNPLSPWSIWTRIPTRSRSRRYQPTSIPCSTSDIPLRSIRIDFHSPSPARLCILHHENDPPTPSSLPLVSTQPNLPIPLPPLLLASTIQEFIGSHHFDLRWPVQHLTFPSAHTILPHSLRNGTLKGVSDGSWKHPMGTAGFLLGDTRHPHLILAQGANHTPPAFPPPLLGSSYRSEIGGLIGIIRFVHFTNILFRPPRGSVTVACDSTSALRQVFGTHALSHQQADYDLLCLARELLRDMPNISFHPRHVKGHQDDAQPFHRLDHWSQWNVCADAIAKNHLRHLLSLSSPPTPYLHTSTWQLWSDSERPWSSFRPQLFYHHCSMISIRPYWAQKRQIPHHLVNHVDWAGIYDAMSRSSHTEQKWIVKHNLDQCGVGQTLLRRRESTSAACPRCSHSSETTSHVMRCHGLDSDKVWSRSLKRLALHLYRTQTDPDLSSTLLSALHSWHSGTLPQCTTSNPLLRLAWESQRAIGWENTLRGFLSVHWAATQARYQASLLLSPRLGPSRWLSALIQRLWTISWHQWEYRNAILHSPAHSHHRNLTRTLDTAIREEYATGPNPSLPSTNPLFRISLVKLLSKPLLYRQHWLNTVEASRTSTIESSTTTSPPTQSTYHPERTALRKWLHTGPIQLP